MSVQSVVIKAPHRMYRVGSKIEILPVGNNRERLYKLSGLSKNDDMRMIRTFDYHRPSDVLIVLTNLLLKKETNESDSWYE